MGSHNADFDRQKAGSKSDIIPKGESFRQHHPDYTAVQCVETRNTAGELRELNKPNSTVYMHVASKDDACEDEASQHRIINVNCSLKGGLSVAILSQRIDGRRTWC